MWRYREELRVDLGSHRWLPPSTQMTSSSCCRKEMTSKMYTSYGQLITPDSLVVPPPFPCVWNLCRTEGEVMQMQR